MLVCLVLLMLLVFLVVGVLSLLERVFVWVSLYEREVSSVFYDAQWIDVHRPAWCFHCTSEDNAAMVDRGVQG